MPPPAAPLPWGSGVPTPCRVVILPRQVGSQILRSPLPISHPLPLCCSSHSNWGRAVQQQFSFEAGSPGDATIVVGSRESTPHGSGKSLGQTLHGFRRVNPKAEISSDIQLPKGKTPRALQLPSQESPATTLGSNRKQNPPSHTTFPLSACLHWSITREELPQREMSPAAAMGAKGNPRFLSPPRGGQEKAACPGGGRRSARGWLPVMLSDLNHHRAHLEKCLFPLSNRSRGAERNKNPTLSSQWQKSALKTSIPALAGAHTVHPATGTARGSSQLPGHSYI